MATKHRCPPYCHKCPEVGGLFPWCMATAVYGEVVGLARCTCDRPTERRAKGEASPWTQIFTRLDRIEKRLAEL